MNAYGIALLTILGILLMIFLYDRITGKNTIVYLVTGKPILTALSLLAKAIGTTTHSAWFEVAYVTMNAAIDATERAE